MKLFSVGKNYGDHKKSYYEKLLAGYDDLKRYQAILSPDLYPVNTDNPINISDKVKFGSCIEEVREKLGSPRYTYTNQSLPRDLNIFLYKKKLGGYKVKLEIHFFRNTLFYFNYIFSYVNNKDKNLLFNILSKKYFQNVSRVKDFEAVDPKGHRVFVEDGLNFRINYLVNDQQMLNRLYGMINKMKNNKKKQLFQHEELLREL